MSRQNAGPVGRVWLYVQTWALPPTRQPKTGQVDAGLRRSIFRKYFVALFAAVVVPLLVNGLSEAWFGYEDQKAMLDARLVVEASAAAGQIEGFLDGIQRQMQWAVQLPWTDSVEDHRIDALRV